jgi:hypothetical protein
VKYGNLYYSANYRNDRLFLNIINAKGPNVFVKKSDLSINSYQIIGSDGSIASYSPSQTFKINGFSEFVRLAYDYHKDGSVCGWQLTPCGSLNTFGFLSDDIIVIEMEISCFMNQDNGNYDNETLLIKKHFKLSDIKGYKEVALP